MDIISLQIQQFYASIKKWFLWFLSGFVFLSLILFFILTFYNLNGIENAEFNFLIVLMVIFAYSGYSLSAAIGFSCGSIYSDMNKLKVAVPAALLASTMLGIYLFLFSINYIQTQDMELVVIILLFTFTMFGGIFHSLFLILFFYSVRFLYKKIFELR